jgi:hypothetical protein
VGRVFRVETGARLRQRRMREIASVIRHGAAGGAAGDARDVVAFIGFALREIVESVDQTAAAWEKRGYWVKADRFRSDWRWASGALSTAHGLLSSADIGFEVAPLLGDLMEPLQSVQPYKRAASQPQWRGSWHRWRRAEEDQSTIG